MATGLPSNGVDAHPRRGYAPIVANTPRLPGEYVEGDTLPALAGFVPFDAAGHTITLTLKQPSGELVERTATLGTYDEDTGKTPISFAWQAGDLVAGERQPCEVRDEVGGDTMTWPSFMLNVRARLA